MDKPDFESLTDAEINRWAVLRDEKLFGNWRFDERCVHNYATSADAALSLCGRWGLRIDSLYGQGDSWYCAIGIFTSRATTAARALLNAACAARHAKEMADGN